MSRIEELMLSAYDLGKENEMFELLTQIKHRNPNMPLEEQYEKAYAKVFKTD